MVNAFRHSLRGTDSVFLVHMLNSLQTRNLFYQQPRTRQSDFGTIRRHVVSKRTLVTPTGHIVCSLASAPLEDYT